MPASPPSPPLTTALVYDFDGTLAPGNIQEHSLIPEHLGVEVGAFWEAVGREKRAHDADEILVYLRLLLDHARRVGAPISREVLRAHGANTPLFNGVLGWFDRINQHAIDRGLKLEHYVVSSGNREMIEGCPISRHFTQVFASSYIYDAAGQAVWPGVAINYTTKTQFLFRINKGVTSCWDNAAVNRWMPMDERPVPFSRMIYLGDGDTDIPSMKTVHHQGGHAIAVFDPNKWQRLEAQEKVYDLISENRAHFVVPADYTEGGQLDITVKGLLGRIAREAGWRG